MEKMIYRANIQKFVDSLSPEQIIFLGTLIESDIKKKDFILLDKLASLMFEKIQDCDKEKLHEKTHLVFSDKISQSSL